MKGLRSTLALLAVLLGLGGYIYFQGATPSDEGTKSEKVFPGLEAAKIEELKVKSQSGDVTTLKKTDGVWAIVQPITAPASDVDASSVANVLADMDVVRVVDEAPADLKEYGLDTPLMEIDFKADGGKMTGRILVGPKTATAGNLYARRDDQKRVVLIGQFHEAGLNKSTFDLRNKQIAKFDRAKVDGITLSVAGTLGDLIKAGDDWRLVKPFASRADNSAVDGLLANLGAAEMKSVASAAPTPDDLKKFGLDKPAVTIALRSGTETLSFLVGSKADDTAVYVKQSLNPDVYTIATTSADDFKKAVEDYRRKELFDLRAFSATHVEFTRAGQTVVLERVKAKEEGKPDTWQRVSPNPGEPDRSKVENLLAGIADIRATSFVASTAGTGLNTPALTVVATFDDGKKQERVLLGRSGSNAFASRPDDPGAAKIEADKLDEALKALDEISK